MALDTSKSPKLIADAMLGALGTHVERMKRRLERMSVDSLDLP